MFMMINYNFVDGVAIEVESLDHRLQLLDLAKCQDQSNKIEGKNIAFTK